MALHLALRLPIGHGRRDKQTNGQDKNFYNIDLCVIRFTKLIRQSDGEQYNKNQFNDMFLTNFKFIIITKNPFPPARLVEMTYPITVCVSSGL